MYNFVIFRGLVFKNYTKLKMLELYNVNIKNLYFLKYINTLLCLTIGSNILNDISGIKHLKNLEHFSYLRHFMCKIDIPILFKNLKTVSIKYFNLHEQELYKLYPFLCSDNLQKFDVSETHKLLIYGICHFYNIDAFYVSQNWIKYCKLYIAMLHRNKQLEELCV